jgi:hypothetical protein
MRTCVWEPGFEAELRRIEPNPELADEIMSGVEWVLAREPKNGTRLPNSELWYIVARDIPRQRHLVIFYASNPEKVFFLSIIQSPLVRI